uniref:DUF4283 domain-containing protein n=1 Tax=Cajanus cajan TaxID=3821 RepID=A0A151SJ89_CAJCA|nr:hypothetical protein KK1_001096 [Cajanus cajan]
MCWSSKGVKVWARKGVLKIFDVPRDYFQILFSSDEHYNRAHMEGPWMVADHYILVQRWRPFFMVNPNIARKVAVWVRVPELPIELFSDQFLWRLGSTLGMMLKIDKVTSQARGKLTRFCVELDLDLPLQPKVIARGYLLNLQYEGLHLICFQCGRYGLKDSSCSEQIGCRATNSPPNGACRPLKLSGSEIKV